MRLASLCGLCVTACASAPEVTPHAPHPGWALALHGGAGVINRDSMSEEQESAYRASLGAALAEGRRRLANGDEALRVVEAVIRQLEDDPLFNAGRGAVLTAEGTFSLDASVMDGRTQAAGAVAAVRTVRHPISAALAVMTDSPHVFLAGRGAETFAEKRGLETADAEHFFTEERWEGLLEALDEEGLPHPPRPVGGSSGPVGVAHLELGTVGVVAMDRRGNLAGGTSTGGTTAKRWGRIGDSPVIGAGTYARNGVCAVSSTGVGEFFLRLAVAHAICARVELTGAPVQAAADHVIQSQLTELGGVGGVIFLGPQGTPGWSFNSDGMYRAAQVEGGEPVVAIYGDEDAPRSSRTR